MAENGGNFWSLESAYDHWIKSQGIPIHQGYYIEDVRTVKVGWWEERQCYGAFIKLAGQEGISEARVTEIPPGKTLPPCRFTLDEAVYVADGRGVSSVWADNGKGKKTFEWQKHSMFLIPRNHYHQMTNMQGEKPVRLLHYNYLPLGMTIYPDPKFFFNNPYVDLNLMSTHDGEFYSEAKVMRSGQGINQSQRDFWYGNFFPDMRNWDRLQYQTGRGGGSRVVHIRFPNTPICSHMSVFPARSYKKAHRHGPGVIIVIPTGEGYSIMWQQGKEKVIIPWHEGSVFVPPNRWFHQHFNVDSAPARYLALRTPKGLSGYSERVEDRVNDQIEYPDEEPWIREKFEAELAKKGVKSLMPEEAYRNKDFEWDYANIYGAGAAPAS
jgi:hypothetical protein